MKRLLSFVLSILFIAVTIPFVKGDQVTANDYDYKISGGEIVISKYNGDDNEVVIPDTIDGYIVRMIGDLAFDDCDFITEVTIPDSVISIGTGVFNDTAYYKDRSNWDNGVLYIGKHLIAADPDIINGDYQIKDGTLTIAGCAFRKCSNLSGVTIPGSVKKIGVYSFQYCYGLKNLIISDGLKKIGFGAFEYCNNLENINIPDSVVEIGATAFNETLFYRDESNWEDGVLYSGKHLLEAKDSITGSYTIKDGTAIIADNAFYGCMELTGVTVPESVSVIGFQTFASCRKLESITVPDSVTIILDHAFESCSSLNEVFIGDGVTEINEYVFLGCAALEKVHIGKNATKIKTGAFDACPSIKNVYYNGFKSQWKMIYIGERNDSLKNTTLHFNECPHDATYVVNISAPTYVSEGYTGDTYCNDCEILLEKGQIVPKQFLKGDATCDGRVNLLDVTAVLKYICEIKVVIDCNAAEVTGDGTVKADDASMILGYIAGL